MESLSTENAKGISVDEVLHDAHKVMTKLPEAESIDPSEFKRAMTIFTRQADRALRKISADPDARLDKNDRLALEAVIRTDGTRPSLLVKDNTIDPNHPTAEAWKGDLTFIRDSVRKRAASIGRIEPAGGSPSRYFGTGWVVDQGKGLVLTNLHVLHAMLDSIPNAMIRTKTGFKLLKNSAFIDFRAEDGTIEKERFRIVSATPSGIDGPNFERLDAAILQVEPLENPTGSAASLPAAIPVTLDLGGPTGAMMNFCVIGFPGAPEVTSGIVDGVDWDWVTRTLFGNRFGVKRLAPGVVHRPLGNIDQDSQKWVFGHDATTLGGNSGSPLLAWKDEKFEGFGLHFAGASADTNYAHALGRCESALRKLGVPL